MELLSPSTGIIFWQVIVFLLLLFLLSKYAWKPILESLKEREVSIQNALDTAEKAKLEMLAMKASNEELLQKAKIERDKILKDAHSLANKISEDAQLDAKKNAERLISDAKRAIEAEKQVALRDVRQLVAELSLDIATKLLKQNLSKDKEQKALAENLIKELNLN